MQILRSILKSGLLLVPEIVQYPRELRDPGDERDKIINVQRRLSLTMLPPAQLPEHCVHFGPISLGFSPLAGRCLGAMPVMYLPQATTDGSEAALDQLGYFFSYRIAELHHMCDRIINLRKATDQKNLSDMVRITDHSGTKEVEISNRLLNALLDMIIGPNNVREFAAVLQSISSLFYPTDEFRHSVELVGSPLYYYLQHEWRILSGIVLDGSDIDQPLTPPEKATVSSSNPGFFNEVISLRHRQVRRVDACTIIRTIGGRPVRELLESVHVPGKWLESTRELLGEFSMGSLTRVVGIDCD
ncbi:hypothetical protein [Mesorhizobium sp. BR1-1-14]|uniref:hypothetical protein n=1 Tax=Mesorhizobium sp. BR1-1-14 TaxID=2876655 RepID=UPI001CD057CC|nr:hypothetical protein [Mesorhizobium sp. BR1-1-14]MBZ9959327.1 hypothetical protein [Mesorhizobium sp. BR1-1-14]